MKPAMPLSTIDMAIAVSTVPALSQCTMPRVRDTPMAAPINSNTSEAVVLTGMPNAESV